MNILMINLPYHGHTNPTLPLTCELVKRGHKIIYINAEIFRAKIEKTGAEFVPYKNFPVTLSEKEKKRRCFRAAFETAMAMEKSFDLLIYEMFFYPGIEIARRKNIPCVRQFSQPAWSKEMWDEAPGIFKISAKLIDLQVLKKKDAQCIGLKDIGLKDGILNSKPDLNIVYVAEQFQNKRELFDDSYIFMIPKSEKNICEVNIPYSQMKRPIVYISLGSIISNKGFCKECIRAFGNKEFSVILNTGKINPDSLGNIPDNIYAYSFVPQIEVLENVDVFLTHCGMNSINEAMYTGVPMVAMPFVNDQLTNAKRLMEMGVAKQVRSFPSRGKELYNKVCQVYKNKEIGLNINRLKEQIENQTDWNCVIERIEALSKK